MKGLGIILEQKEDSRLKDYLDNFINTDKTQDAITDGKLLSDDVVMCKVCNDLVENGEFYDLVDEDGDENLTVNFEDLYIDASGENFKKELDKIVTDARKEIDNVRVGIVFEIDTTMDPYDKLDQKEKDKFLSLTSNELDLIEYVCYLLETLLAYATDSKASEPTKALTYYKEICKLFKPKKAAEEEVVNPVDDEDEAKGKMGCMKEGASNYNSIYKRACDGCCTYKVPLAPISYNISFYKAGEFPSPKKAVTMKTSTEMKKIEYEVCVLEYEYDNNMVNGEFIGYQDDNVPSLGNIKPDRFKFKDDVGFYGVPDETLISDVNRAMTWYMARASKSTKTTWDDCIPSPLSMNGITVEIKDKGGVNHGVIRFGDGKPTLRIDAPSFTKWLDYRASNTPNGRKNDPNNVKFANPDDVGTFYDMTCKRYNNVDSWTSKSVHGCDGSDYGGWLTLSNTVKSESKIGLGTLLGRKEKTITGLGSLLED